MSFSNDAFIHALDGVRRNMNDSKRYIKTGIKRLNKMLNGGFQPGRCYVFCGTSSGLTFSSL
jgi:RecA/RadA recombinase